MSPCPTVSLFRLVFPLAPPAIQIELTAQLISNSRSIGIFGVAAAAVGIQATLNQDVLHASLLLSIAMVSATRVIWLRWLRRRHGTRPAESSMARRWEHRYAAGSFATSLLLGANNFFALSYRDPTLTILVICGLCCYVFSLILCTAVRPLVCLPSVAITLALSLAGLPLFVNEGTRLDTTFASAALATVAILMAATCLQLSAHIYRTMLRQLMAQRDLMRFARQDPLTGLENRLALRERFEMLAPGPTRPAALLYLDLDGFKPVNDLHGHQVGDALLRAVAKRLTVCLPPSDTVFRIGGDEFAVLQTHVRQRSDTMVLARRLLESLSEPFELNDSTVHIGASIGIALADTANAELDCLAAAADAALYNAKRSGRGTFRFTKDSSSPLQLIA